MRSISAAWETYYYQKILHHVFGIVDASSSKSHVYVVDETVAGEKDANHVCSFLEDYVQNVVDPRAKFLRLYFDAAAYFKSKFLVWWAEEQVICGRFTRVVLSYMVPGHTKFEPDSLFARIAHRFYITDVFQTSELLRVICDCGAVPHEFGGNDIRQWKVSMKHKFVEIPRITEWNLLVIERESRMLATGNESAGATLKVKHSVENEEFCESFHCNTSALQLVCGRFREL